MRTPVEEMNREQLLAELPKRFLAMAVFLGGICFVLSVLAFIMLQTEPQFGWLAAFLGSLLASPLAVSRVARWMIRPAQERLERRRASIHRALAEFSFGGGDSRV